jgi:hypothetical protein
MTNNPFAQEQAWELSDGGGILPDGDHKVFVLEVDGTSTSSGSHPQIVVKCGNDDGEIRDWIVVIPATIGKVNQLTDAIGLDRPDDEQVKPEGTGFRLKTSYLNQMLGKPVGVRIKSKPKRNDPSQTFSEVLGYMPASQVESDVTNNLDGTGAPTSSKDESIPF